MFRGTGGNITPYVGGACAVSIACSGVGRCLVTGLRTRETRLLLSGERSISIRRYFSVRLCFFLESASMSLLGPCRLLMVSL
jgi:hypothetical protein